MIYSIDGDIITEKVNAGIDVLIIKRKMSRLMHLFQTALQPRQENVRTLKGQCNNLVL